MDKNLWILVSSPGRRIELRVVNRIPPEPLSERPDLVKPSAWC
jgi:hypothetical protein